MKIFLFVTSNGVQTGFDFGNGSNRKEAQKELETILPATWYIVEDPKIIKFFINEVENRGEKSGIDTQFIEQLKTDYLQTFTQLEVIEKALKMGGQINIRFSPAYHQFTKSQAEEIAKEISEKLGCEYQKCNGHDWFEMKDKWGSQIDFTVHYKNSKEDEIQKLKERIAQLEQEETA